MVETAEQALQTAASYIREVAQQVPEFRKSVAQQSEYVRREDTGWLSSFISKFKVGRTKKGLVSDLERADEEIARAAAADRDARIQTHDGEGTEVELTIPELKVWRHQVAAHLHIQDGRLEKANSALERALEIGGRSEAELTSYLHFLRGSILEALGRPREACRMYARAEEIRHEEDDAIEARKQRQRLESEKIFGQFWFTGSWKVAGLLLFLVVAVTVGLFSDPEPGGVGAVAMVGGGTALYFWRKLES